MKNITQSEVKGIFNYDPETGDFTWRVDRGTRAKAGDKAGCNHNGYIRVGLDGRNYLVHRLIWLYMTGAFPDGEIDHINRVKDDNRFGNLRVVSSKGNSKNLSLSKANTTGISGVFWDKKLEKWQVQIRGAHEGFFPCLLDAVATRFRVYKELGFDITHGVS